MNGSIEGRSSTKQKSFCPSLVLETDEPDSRVLAFYFPRETPR